MINRHMVMIVGSAPEYPHGSIDPIEAMGAIAQRHGIALHVDACVSGFILPFMEMNGIELPRWDWRVPGVTSISADLHKYGFAAKGASTISYRDLALLKHQMFVSQDWPGGVFASPALLGTRPGGAYAAAWAALQHFGIDGYRELAARTSQAFSRMRHGIEAMPELRVPSRRRAAGIAGAGRPGWRGRASAAAGARGRALRGLAARPLMDVDSRPRKTHSPQTAQSCSSCL